MTTLHIQEIGRHALVPREELERIVELARRSESVVLQIADNNVPSTAQLMALSQQSGAFDWLETEDDLYSANDLKARYR